MIDTIDHGRVSSHAYFPRDPVAAGLGVLRRLPQKGK